MTSASIDLTRPPVALHYYLGIDGGGTKCKGRLCARDGTLLAEAVAGPANIATDLVQAQHSMLDVCQQLLQQAGLSQAALQHCAVVAGLAGANLPAAAARFQAWAHPFAALQLTTDLHIACLGAHSGEDGAMLICGTGTAAFAHVGGQHFLFSAQGFPLGDKGSGAWLGWRAISHTLDVLDGLQPVDGLSQAVCRALLPAAASDAATPDAATPKTATPNVATPDATSLISACRDFRAGDFATLAPVLLNAAAVGETAACAVRAEGVAYLVALLERLRQTGARRIALAGGVGAALINSLPAHWQQQLSRAALPPEAGAVLLARQLFIPSDLTQPALHMPAAM